MLTLTSGLFKKKNKKKEKKEEEKEKKAFQVCIHVARARAHASLQQFEECLKECNEILQMKPNLAVANWLKAKALIGLGGAYEARIYLYKCRRSLSISSNTTKSANEKQTSKRMNENDELEVEIEAVEETCKHALPDDPELRVEKRGGNKRGSKKNVTVKAKKNEKGDEDDEAEEDEEGEEIYLIENEKTDDDKEEKTSADVTKSSMTSWADEVEQEQTEEEGRGEIPFIASIPMVSFVHLAIENDDAKKDCLDSLKKYGSVRVAMPDEAFDISLGETLAKVIECFESEYYESDDVEFFAPAWELNVDEKENVVEEKQVVVVEEDKEEEDLAEKSEGYLSYANIAKKNARLRSNGFNATESKANEISMFPPLSLKNDKLEREWNEPPAEEDADPRPARKSFRVKVLAPPWPTRRKFSKWSPCASSEPSFDNRFKIFTKKNVNFTRYSIISRALRRSFSKASASVIQTLAKASFYARNPARSSLETTTTIQTIQTNAIPRVHLRKNSPSTKISSSPAIGFTTPPSPPTRRRVSAGPKANVERRRRNLRKSTSPQTWN